MVGNGPLPCAGSVTSASSGTPSKDGTRWAEPDVGQKRTPFCAWHECPNGAGCAADAARAPNAQSMSAPVESATAVRLPMFPSPITP
jgi:hypothetical protein